MMVLRDGKGGDPRREGRNKSSSGLLFSASYCHDVSSFVL
jgi:hypothetical protein